jgi:hypothetical protein
VGVAQTKVICPLKLGGCSMRINLFLFLIAISLSVTACQTSGSGGKGPITLNANSIANYGISLLFNHSNSGSNSFAIAADGKNTFFMYCPLKYIDGCASQGSWEALSKCNEIAEKRGVKCSVFAYGSRIVWNGPIFYEDYKDDFLFVYMKNQGSRKRSFKGTGRKERGNSLITIKSGQCRGEVNLNTKKWFIKDCKNGDAIKGTFVAGEGISKFRGIGGNDGGGEVKMLLLDPSSDPRFTKAKASSYSSLIANKSTSDICNGLKYGKPDFVKEAKRRGITEKSCANQTETKITKSPGSGTVEDRLAKLKTLLSQGLLTPDEAAAKRKEILEGL